MEKIFFEGLSLIPPAVRNQESVWIGINLPPMFGIILVWIDTVSPVDSNLYLAMVSIA